MLSVSEGEGAFDQPGVNSGTVESSLTSVNPYVRYQASERLSAWGLLGYGTGDMTMTQAATEDRGEIVTRTDISMRLGAAGARGVLLKAGEDGGIDLALRGDAFLVQMDWEKVSNETDTRADASRLRLVRLDPGASGRGLLLTLAPVWGTPSSGVDRLWSARDAAGLAPGGEFEAERRLEAELGYGFGAPRGLGVVTPYAGLSLAADRFRQPRSRSLKRRGQPADMSRPLRGNDTELRQMAAQRIDRLGALVHQKIARPEQHAPSLLFLRLHSHKSHGRARRRLADRLRVRRIVLLPLHIRFDVDRRDQSHRMAEPADLPAPMVRATARLHRHRAAWLRSHKVQQLRPAQLLTERNRPVRPRTVHLKAVLRQIDPDRDAVGRGVHPIVCRTGRTGGARTRITAIRSKARSPGAIGHRPRRGRMLERL